MLCSVIKLTSSCLSTSFWRLVSALRSSQHHYVTDNWLRIYIFMIDTPAGMCNIKVNHHHHHNHISVMELGHLLTRSGLTYPAVSPKVCHDSFCQLEKSVSLPWVLYYEAKVNREIISILLHSKSLDWCKIKFGSTTSLGARGGVVVKALRYKPAGRGFDFRWCHWNFSVT
jgi:hypothetical protein